MDNSVTDTQIIDVIRDEFGTLADFTEFVKYGKKSQTLAFSKARVCLKNSEITDAQTAGNAEVVTLQAAMNAADADLKDFVNGCAV